MIIWGGAHLIAFEMCTDVSWLVSKRAPRKDHLRYLNNYVDLSAGSFCSRDMGNRPTAAASTPPGATGANLGGSQGQPQQRRPQTTKAHKGGKKGKRRWSAALPPVTLPLPLLIFFLGVMIK